MYTQNQRCHQKRISQLFIMCILGTMILMVGCATSENVTDTSAEITAPVTVTNSASGNDEGVGATDGSVTALTVSTKVSVVDANKNGSVSRLARLSASDVPAGSPYHTDPVHFWVEERSVDALSTVNEILCMLGQAGYSDMLNKGAYVAQIDANTCSSEQDDASSAGQSSSSSNQSSSADTPDYELWTLESYRQDNDSAHYVKLWVTQAMDMQSGPGLRQGPGKGEGDGHGGPGEGEGGGPGGPGEGGGGPGEGGPSEQQIQAKIKITEAASDSNPYGLFVMNFKILPVFDGNVANFVMGKGLLKAAKDKNGQVVVSFIMDMGGDEMGFKMTQQVALSRAADGSSGAGTLYESFKGFGFSDTQNFNIAFDSANFLRSDGSSQICTSRSEFDETVWRYGLYDSTGKRVQRNSGFPIKFTGSSGKEHHGFVSYHGLWTEGSASLTSGSTVSKVEFGPNGDQATTDYTVFIAGGKLQKHTRQLLKLSDIKGIPLNYRNWQSGDQTEYVVKWNGTTFDKTAAMDDNHIPVPLETPVALDLSALQWTQLDLWSQALGGNAKITFKTDAALEESDQCTGDSGSFKCTPTDTTVVVFFAENTIGPADLSADLSLACLSQCPNPANVNTDTPYFSDTTFNRSSSSSERQQTLDNQAVPPDQAKKYSYAFGKGTMLLSYEGTGIERTATSSDFELQYGIRSGPLFEFTSANLAKLACKTWAKTGTKSYTDSSGATQTYPVWEEVSGTCGHKAWDQLDVFYTYSSGKDNWNKYTGLKDASGNFLSFEAPLQIKYTHNDATSGYNATAFYLEYSGFGELHGIPGKCIDADTGAETQCRHDENGMIRWVPEFNVKSGTEVSDAKGTKYLIKALNGEQRMKQVETTSCSMSLTTFDLPAIDQWIDPKTGDEPALDAAPAVIGGEVQRSPVRK